MEPDCNAVFSLAFRDNSSLFSSFDLISTQTTSRSARQILDHSARTRCTFSCLECVYRRLIRIHYCCSHCWPASWLKGLCVFVCMCVTVSVCVCVYVEYLWKCLLPRKNIDMCFKVTIGSFSPNTTHSGRISVFRVFECSVIYWLWKFMRQLNFSGEINIFIKLWIQFTKYLASTHIWIWYPTSPFDSGMYGREREREIVKWRWRETEPMGWIDGLR